MLSPPVGLQDGAELRQCGASHEGGVGDGDEHRHAGVAGLVVDFVELHGLEVRLVAEGVAAEGHRAVRRVHIVVVVEAGIDDGVGDIVAHLLDVGVIDEVLLRRGDDVASAHKAHLVDVGEDVLTHALMQQVAVVRSGAAPAFRCNLSGYGCRNSCATQDFS